MCVCEEGERERERERVSVSVCGGGGAATRERMHATWVTDISSSRGVLNQERVGVGVPPPSQGSLAVLPAITPFTPFTPLV